MRDSIYTKVILQSTLLVFCLSIFTFEAYANAYDSKIADNNPSDTNRLNKLLRLSEKLTTNNQDQAHEIADEALSLSTKLKNDDGIAKSLNIIGNIYLNQSDYYEAKHHFEQSIEYFKSSNNKSGMAGSFSGLGENFEKHGKYNEAIESFEQAYQIYNQTSDEKAIASTCNNLGVLFYLIGDVPTALKYYSEAQQILENSDDSINLRRILINKSLLFLENKDVDSARSYLYQKPLSDKKNLKQPDKAEYYLLLGQLELSDQDPKKALNYYDSAYVIAKNSQLSSAVCKSLIGKSKALTETGAYNLSINQLSDCVKLLEKQENTSISMECLLLLSENYALLNDYQKSLLYFKEYEHLRYTELQKTNYKAEADAYIKKQQEENLGLILERDRATRKLQLIIFLSLILILTLSFIFALIVFRIRQKSDIEKIISAQQKLHFNASIEAQEIERKRIASDLHDSVGQMLSLIKLNVSELNESICTQNSENQELLERSLTIIDNACEEVRTISHNLMPGSLIRLGLISATKDVIRNINSTSEIKVNLNTQLNGVRFKEKVEIAFFRIFQELINNSIKHSHATNIDVELSYDNQVLKMSVKDNGVGFSKESAFSGKGIGWKNIKSRLSLINGDININSSNGLGSLISVWAETT